MEIEISRVKVPLSVLAPYIQADCGTKERQKTQSTLQETSGNVPKDTHTSEKS